jgi:hypothetical protein
MRNGEEKRRGFEPLICLFFFSTCITMGLHMGRRQYGDPRVIMRWCIPINRMIHLNYIYIVCRFDQHTGPR